MGWFSRKLHPQMQHELAAIADRDDPNAWRAILRAQGHAEVAALLEGQQRSAVALQTLTALRPLPLGASRIGGAPDLPADFGWPEGQALLAQINCGDVPRLHGHLWVFGDDAGNCSVHWRPGDTPLQRHDRARYTTCEIRAKSYVDVPDIEGLTDAQQQCLSEVRAYLSGARAHKLLGHPNWDEKPKMPEGYTLLLQIDNDAYAKMQLGKIYFVINDDDLDAGHFARVRIMR